MIVYLPATVLPFRRLSFGVIKVLVTDISPVDFKGVVHLPQ
jgi:hypothetical protein